MKTTTSGSHLQVREVVMAAYDVAVAVVKERQKKTTSGSHLQAREVVGRLVVRKE